MANKTATATVPAATVPAAPTAAPLATPATSTAIPAAVAPAAKAKKETISDRKYFTATGVECLLEEASYMSYILVWDKYKTEEFKYQPAPGLSPADRWFALFGFPTKVGNVVNSWKTAAPHLRAATPNEAIRDFLLRVNDPVTPSWKDTAPTGARIDFTLMAQAVLDTAGKGAATLKLKDGTYDVAGLAKKLETDVDFLSVVRRNPPTTARYGELIGKPTSSLDDILSM